MADTTANYDQVVQSYKCGTADTALKSSNPENESLTNLVMIKLQRLKDEFPSQFAAHVCIPSLEFYLDKLACAGQDNQLSNYCAYFIMGQIELCYIESNA